MGRDGSPVLDHYPPKDPALSVRGPPTPAVPQIPVKTMPPLTSPSSAPAGTVNASQAPPVPGGAGAASAPKPLILLEKPFDLDEFAQLLGETTIRVEVPREDLAEALRRISDFMGFGIYVYSFRVRPAAEELLKRFVIELQRVDFSSTKGDWAPFEEKGRSDSPFGPSGGRR
ncbi:MAG: hypothetical protein L3J93_00515 [Thermoplasmata archaeon]|nr:hypothetical protein [Thermoplasmata archaeon]